MSEPIIKDRDTWVFDLDNTLYPATSDLFPQIHVRMTDFIAGRLRVGSGEAERLRRIYYERYGTTLRGLMLDRAVDPEEFLGYVHNIDLSGLAPNPRLGAAIGSLPGRKLIYTNGSREHAERVLARLGIGGLFAGIFDIRAAAFMPKPNPPAYHHFIAAHGVDPKRSVMVEDMAANLIPAAALGMTTVWLPPDGEEGDFAHVDYRVSDLTAWLEGLAGSGEDSRRAAVG